jgi:uncharacterized protein (TIGR02466 family)
MAIVDIFPTPVYHEILDIDEKSLESMNTYTRKHFNPPAGHQDFFLQSPGDLAKHEDFEILKNRVETAATEFWHSVGYERRELKITQMWGNYMKGRGFISEHNHSNSLVSGIFYLDVSNGSGATVFTDTYHGIHKMINVPNEKDTRYNSHRFTVNPKNNMLILFPSYLNHYSDPCTDGGERITISMNFLPNELGGISGLNHCAISF